MQYSNIMSDLFDYRESLDESNRGIYDLFEKYKPESGIFIETGCHLGGGLAKAIHAGFTTLYSCDINMERVEASIEKVSELAQYGATVDPYIYNCHSISFLLQVLPIVEEEALFWLDAHDEGGGVPVLEELVQIKELFKNRKSTIMIDDVPLYLSQEGVDELKKTIREINEDYEFETLTTNKGGNYVIVASIVEKEEK